MTTKTEVKELLNQLGVTAQQHFEAPASINFNVIDNDGYQFQITLRDTNEMELMARTGKIKLWLQSKNIVPVGKYGSQLPPSEVQKPQDGFPAADQGYCTIHSTTMKQRGSGNDTWFSHKVGDDWCRGE